MLNTTGRTPAEPYKTPSSSRTSVFTYKDAQTNTVDTTPISNLGSSPEAAEEKFSLTQGATEKYRDKLHSNSTIFAVRCFAAVCVPGEHASLQQDSGEPAEGRFQS